jgi:putative methyltransferase (TIGR04325 family)
MSIQTRMENILKLFIPPIVIKGARFVQNLLQKPDLYSMGFHTLEYAPNGWQTQLNNNRNKGWSVNSVIDTEKAKWDVFCRNLEGPGPLGFSHEHTDLSIIRNPNFHNVHISYAYVLALTAHKKDSISVLDWGGALGHYYLVAKAVLPGVDIDFHVKEVPLMAKAGEQLNPEVHWYDDETCLERDYDLVMMTGSIPYMEDWADVLHRIARSIKEYLFISRLPVVEHSPSFVAVQRLYNSQMLHQQINQTELLETVRETGLTLVREFVVGDRPYIKGAPEQCEVRGWLFKRETMSRAYS